VGPYRLVATDIDDDMAICWSTPGGGCLVDGLPGPTVFAVGFDDKYLVAAVHPSDFDAPPNRSIIHYYYVIRSPEEIKNFPSNGIRGPFNEVDFFVEKGRLHLPEFTMTFENLRQ
jgi:hypothetical protein